MSDVELILGDCLEVMPRMEAGGVDAIITIAQRRVQAAQLPLMEV